jgi:hypothetical protein
MLEQHRDLLLSSIEPDLPMRFFVTRGAVHVYIGLWATWWVNGANSEAKIVIAGVPTAPGAPTAPLRPTALLGELPVRVLQFQTVTQHTGEGSADAARLTWAQVAKILAADMESLRENTEKRRGVRLTFDATQDTHKLRCFRDPEVLGAYRIRRIDLATDALCVAYNGPVPCPAKTMEREFVVYECYNTIADRKQSAPCWIYVERPVPKHGQRVLNIKETGYVKDSDLLSAIGEWKTWLVLDAAKTELEFLQ